MGLIVHGSYINGLSEKVLVRDKSGSTVTIALQSCKTKGSKRDMEIILMVFLKEILFRGIWSFWNKNRMVSSSL